MIITLIPETNVRMMRFTNFYIWLSFVCIFTRTEKGLVREAYPPINALNFV